MAGATLPLHQLIELTKEKVDTATKELGLLQQAREAAVRQLRMLEDYLADYRVRLQEAGQTGLSAAGWHNYQEFMKTLEAAIGEQQRQLALADTRLDQGRQSWQDQRRRLSSFDALVERHNQAQAARESRQEQRLNDEFSSQMYHRRASARG